MAERETAAEGKDQQFWFGSFQDLGGRAADGSIKAHNEAIHLVDWDCIVIDEYHFGAWRDAARDLYDPTEKALAEREEPEDSRSEEHTSELQSLMRNSYAVFCLKTKSKHNTHN